MKPLGLAGNGPYMYGERFWNITMFAPEQPRTILNITGPDRIGFLQNLVTNDIEKSPITYNALLTPQGKYLADFFVIQQPDALWLDVATSHAAGLMQRLTMYRLRADVQIALTEMGVSCGTDASTMPDDGFADPRHTTLGWRRYHATSRQQTFDWAALRVAHIIPETGIELTPDSYILEHGFERLNGVDFKKGCYVGQEVTARMKHKTELRKGLAHVVSDHPLKIGMSVFAENKTVGKILTTSGTHAIAYLRNGRANMDLTVDGENIAIIGSSGG